MSSYQDIQRERFLQKRAEFYRRIHAAGMNIIPLNFGSKTPKIAWTKYKFNRVSSDLLDRWLKVEEMNFGIITGAISGFIVIDIEDERTKSFLLPLLPNTPLKVKTAKMEHWYYKIPQDMSVPRKIRVAINRSPLNADQLGDGGYAVGPYSLHPSDHLIDQIEYEKLDSMQKLSWAKRQNVRYMPIGNWKNPLEAPEFRPGVFDTPIPVYGGPTRYVSVRQLDYGGLITRATNYISKMPGAISGSGGNNQTFIAACRLVKHFGLCDQSALSILKSHYNPRCLPPWSDSELEKFIKNARLYGKGGHHG